MTVIKAGERYEVNEKAMEPGMNEGVAHLGGYQVTVIMQGVPAYVVSAKNREQCVLALRGAGYEVVA